MQWSLAFEVSSWRCKRRKNAHWNTALCEEPSLHSIPWSIIPWTKGHFMMVWEQLMSGFHENFLGRQRPQLIRRLSQEDCWEVGASLSYSVRSYLKKKNKPCLGERLFMLCEVTACCFHGVPTLCSSPQPLLDRGPGSELGTAEPQLPILWSV